MKLSNQALGAVMLALQKGVMEQEDITGLLRDFELEENNDGELEVSNPPTISVQDSDDA
tara:strand:+ start:265 stop:441 length:177 start_codon:yes stop_codon:yes gene_type:complete